jgi:hypothetical protein
MVTRLGTQLGTTLGTDLSTFSDVAPPLPPIYALTSFSGANYYATQAAGGEAGVSSGFGVAVLLQLGADYAGTAVLASKDTTGPAGWLSYVTASKFAFAICNAAGTKAFVEAPRRHIVASDVGKIFLFVGYMDAAGTNHAYVDRDERLTGTANVNGYTPGTNPSRIGLSYSAATPPTSTKPIAMCTFRATPTLAQVQSFYDQTRALNGDLPDTIAGSPVTHVLSLRRALAGQVVTAGQTAPATIADAITGVTDDVATRQGTPTIALIDPATPKLWNYETTPIAYGMQATTDADYYDTTAGTIPAGGGFAVWVGRIESQQLASASRWIFSKETSGGTAGFDLRTTGTNSSMFFIASNGVGGGVLGPTAALSANDVGKIMCIVGVIDTPGSKLRMYLRRVEQGTGSAMVGHTPSAQPLRIGRCNWQTATSATGISTIGIATGSGVPTLAQIQALHDAVIAAEDIQAIPGMTDFMISFKNASTAPATLTDSVSGATVTRAGSPTMLPIHARAFAW